MKCGIAITSLPTRSPPVVSSAPVSPLPRTLVVRLVDIAVVHRRLVSGTVKGDVKEVCEGSPWWCESANEVVGDPNDCGVYVCSLARLASTPNGAPVLEPPPSDKPINQIRWEDPAPSCYPSNWIFYPSGVR